MKRLALFMEIAKHYFINIENFKKGNLKAIRHVMTPSVSYNYRPDFGDYYEEVQQSADPEDIIEYSPYANGIYGNPGRGLSNSFSLGVNNTLEAKAASKDSLATGEDAKDRIITILNNLNFSTAYDLAADSLKWSPVAMNAGTFLFDKKMQINLNATLDPYALSLDGKRINTPNIKSDMIDIDKNNVKKFIYASSSSVYGESK